MSRNRSRSSVSPMMVGLLSLGLMTSAPGGNPFDAFSIPLTGHGDSLRGSAGAAIALSPTSFLVGVEGPDGAATTADDQILLVTNVDTVPVITPLPISFRSNYSGRITRFSATRAGTLSAGPNGTWGNADDQFVLLDRLGSDDLITPLTIGGLENSDSFTAVAVTTDSAVMRSRGPDNLGSTADDELVLLTDLGSANTETHLSAPFTQSYSHSTPVVLSPTTVVVVSLGPDALRRTADDALHIFTGLGTTNSRTTLPLPFITEYAGGRPSRVSPTSVVLNGCGLDGADGTADDQLRLVRNIGTTNTVTDIPIPSIQFYGGGRAAVLSETVVAISTEGPDSVRENADDTLAIVTGLGTSNTVTHLTVGGLGESAGSAPQRLSSTSVAFATGGANFQIPSSDDEVVIVSGVGTTNTVTRAAVSGLDEGVVSQPVPLGTSSLLLGGGGANAVMDSGADDLLSVVTGLPSAPVVSSVPASNELDTFALSCSPHSLGEGRAVCFTSGPNNSVGSGNDDVLRVLTGLPQPLGLIVESVNLKFNASNPGSKQNLEAKGTLLLDDPTVLDGVDITVSLGNIAQRVPAALVRKKRNGIFEYSDPNGARGFLKKLTLNTKKGTFSIQGKGTETGIESTSAGYIPVAIEAGETYLSDLVAGTANSKGIRFKR